MSQGPTATTTTAPQITTPSNVSQAMAPVQGTIQSFQQPYPQPFFPAANFNYMPMMPTPTVNPNTRDLTFKRTATYQYDFHRGQPTQLQETWTQTPPEWQQQQLQQQQPSSYEPRFEYPTSDDIFYDRSPQKTELLSKGSLVSFDPSRRSRWSPNLDVYEDDKNIFIECELPGFTKERIDINVYGEEHRKLVVILGEEEEKRHSRAYVVRERGPARGRFKRTVHLPQYAETDKIEATYNNGVLVVTVPKSDHAVQHHRMKKIEIRDHAGFGEPIIRSEVQDELPETGPSSIEAPQQASASTGGDTMQTE